MRSNMTGARVNHACVPDACTGVVALMYSDCDSGLLEKLPLSDPLLHSNTGIPTMTCMIVLWLGHWSSESYMLGVGSQWILLSEAVDLILRLSSLFSAFVPHHLLGAS